MEDRDVAFCDLNASLGLPLSCPDQAYFGVYDGHDGDEVSKMLGEQLHMFVQQAPDFDTDPVAALMTGFLVRCCQPPERSTEQAVWSQCMGLA